MAFCTSCGSQIDDRAAFCSKCGASTLQTAVSVPPSAAYPPSAARKGSTKIVLAVVAALFGLALIAMIVSVIIGLRIARRSRIEQGEDRTLVQTPFGSVRTSKNPAEIAENLGVDLYPGAKPFAEGASVNIAGNNIASGKFVTSDTPNQVFAFYQKRYPRASVQDSRSEEKKIVVQSGGGVISIKIAPFENGARFEIANIGVNSSSHSESDTDKESN